MEPDSTLSALTAARRHLRRSTDPRAADTRARIVAAAEALAASPESLNVSAIVRGAGTSRATFYTYFGGLEELAAHMQESALEEIVGDGPLAPQGDGDPRSPATFAHDALRQLSAHMDEHRQFYAAVLALSSSSLVQGRFADVIGATITGHMAGTTPPPDGLRVELGARIVAAGYAALLCDWVQGTVDGTVEEISWHMFTVMPEWLY